MGRKQSRLLPCPGYDKQCCDGHWGTRVSFRSGFLGVYAQEWDCWLHATLILSFFFSSDYPQAIVCVLSRLSAALSHVPAPIFPARWQFPLSGRDFCSVLFSTKEHELLKKFLTEHA